MQWGHSVSGPMALRSFQWTCLTRCLTRYIAELDLQPGDHAVPVQATEACLPCWSHVDCLSQKTSHQGLS